MATIPLVDLKAQHRLVAEEVQKGFARVFDATNFIDGAEVRAFEEAFAAFAKVKHCVGVANGTDALELALRASGIGPGHEVIVPANTFIATPLAVARTGATPVFVDCDPTHYLIDVQQAARRVTRRTRAIMPVHLYGQIAPMEQVAEFASAHRLTIVEDAAQSHGAVRAGKCSGHWGVSAGVSFYPGKNLGAYGDAGAVLTESPEVAQRLRGLRNYGSDVKYHHPETGFNSRLDTLQAVVLMAKLAHLEMWNEARRVAAARYDEMLAGVAEITRPAILAGNTHVYHLYVVRVPRRDAVLKQLHAAGIGAGIHYPVACHLQGAFRHLGYQRGDMPVSERAADEILSLPLFPGITADQQQRVVAELLAAVQSTATCTVV